MDSTHDTCDGSHLQSLNNAPIVPGEVHHGVPADFAVTEPLPSVLHNQLGPSEQRLNLALKVCWDCNPTIPRCKEETQVVHNYKVNPQFSSYTISKRIL